MKYSVQAKIMVAALVLSCPLMAAAADEAFAPYGTAKVDMHEYPVNIVFDVN